MRIFFYTLLVALLFAVVEFSFAQNVTAPSNNSITISGSRFTYDLVRQWIQDFNEVYPDVVIQIVPRETPYAEQANLVINAHDLDSFEVRQGYGYIKLGRYVILPVANKNGVIAKAYRNKPFTQSDLKDLFFDPLQELDNEQQITDRRVRRERKSVQIYTRQRIACSNTAFASYYGYSAKDIRGKLIVGEDKHLIFAIAKDTAGLTYGIPSIIYDLKTRKLRKEIEVLKTENLAKAIVTKGIDLNDLDLFTSYLESNGDKLDVPLVYFHVSPKKELPNHSAEKRFVQYILTKGQNRLHEFGYLSPEEKEKSKGIEQISF